MAAQAGALGRKLAQQSVDVLATAVPPKAVRIAEVRRYGHGLTNSRWRAISRP